MGAKKQIKKMFQDKKKVISICLSVILLVLVVVGLSILSVFKTNELNYIGVNTIYTNENQENEEENRFLVIDPTENEDDTKEDQNNESNEENNVTAEKPKKVDIPYYIKVNNEANVVTIYKKDSKRKLHSTSKSNGLLNW